MVHLDGKNRIRDKALAAIDDVTWYPKTGRNRIYAMIENRPDWVVCASAHGACR